MRCRLIAIGCMLFLVALPLSAAEADPDAIPKQVIREAVQDAVKPLRDDLANLKTQLELLRQLKELQEKTVREQDARIRELQRQIEALQLQVKAMNDQLTTTTQRVANFGPTTSSDSGSGRIQLVNEYLTDMSVVVNGKAFTVPRGQSMTLGVAPGAYTYQVVGVHTDPVTGRVETNETRQIRIFPRQ